MRVHPPRRRCEHALDAQVASRRTPGNGRVTARRTKLLSNRPWRWSARSGRATRDKQSDPCRMVSASAEGQRWPGPPPSTCLCCAGTAGATASSTLWTNMTPDIQSFGVIHLGVDNYTTVGRKLTRGGGDFPTDFGLTVGVLLLEKLQMEIGVDVLEPSDDPLSANFKLGAPEGALSARSPALYAGMFGVGTRRGSTDYDVAYLAIGKTFPESAASRRTLPRQRRPAAQLVGPTRGLRLHGRLGRASTWSPTPRATPSIASCWPRTTLGRQRRGRGRGRLLHLFHQGRRARRRSRLVPRRRSQRPLEADRPARRQPGPFAH